MTTYKNNGRIVTIRQDSYGSFEVYIGYVDDLGINMSGMQVCGMKKYKRETMAQKFCQQWLNG